VNHEQFVRKLEKAGIEYTLLCFHSATSVVVGRFGYMFDEEGNSAGGWIRNCGDDWRAEWQKWAALLKEPSRQGGLEADSCKFPAT